MKIQEIPKQEYTAEFREQAVKRVKDDKSVGAVADFDAGALNGTGTTKQMELSRLYPEVVRA